MRSLRTTVALLGLVQISLCSAQTTYWGMTSNGGSAGIGTIYSITESNTFTKRFDMTRYEGGSPKGDLVKASNGLYYGVTEVGGAGGGGTIFSYNPTTGVYTTVYEFATLDGTQPIRGLALFTNGSLYGMCSTGGANNLGTIFQFNPTTNAFNKRFDFTGTPTGRTPRGNLVLAANGSFYGVTQLGGANGRGVIFKYSPPTTYSALYSFAATGVGTTGGQPFSGMIKASNNLLYGVTQTGGLTDEGVLYQFNTAGVGTYTPLHDFDNATGSAPVGELMQNGTGGLLYGTTTIGGANNLGTIFTWNITTPGYAVVHDFANATGYKPYGKIIRAASGLLYGVTKNGGSSDDGVLYSLNTTTNFYTQLADMNAIGLFDVWGGLLEDPNGTLWGLANGGGAVASGAIFRYVVATNTLTQVLPMALSQGSYSKSRLYRAYDGNFYGMTTGGGFNQAGVLFSFNPTTSTYTRLMDLGGTNGGSPYGSLVELSGKLYGVCSDGGGLGGGTLFEYTIATNTFVKKQDLGSTTGFAPLAGLFKASNGKLYGMTTLGGANNLGTLFDYVPSSNTITKRADLSTITGTQPMADLYQASDGMLYGTCSENGTFTNGTLFRFDPVGNGFTKLYDFDGLQGGVPAGELVQHSNGKLYGICRDGGLFFNGCIYSWTIASSLYTEEYDMQTSEGSVGESGMLEGTDTKLYGTLTQGGTGDNGVLFKFVTTTAAFTVTKSFTLADGLYPFNGLARDVIPPAPGVQLSAKIFLEGPYNSGTGLMTDALRTLPTFPLTEPFTAMGLAGGGSTINASVLTVTGNSAITDWIYVELRTGALPGVVAATRSGLVQRDGDIVDLDGVSPLAFSVTAGNYRVVVRHRNHLGVMTANEVALSSTPLVMNLIDGSTAMYGTDPQKLISTTRVSWAGNARYDNLLKYTGTNNDRDLILVAIGGIVPTNTVSGYRSEDVNMDGIVKYTGTANDRDVILVNIGGIVPTTTKTEQVP